MMQRLSHTSDSRLVALLPTGVVMLLALVLTARARAQEPAPKAAAARGKAAAGVRDGARLFKAEVVGQANQELERLERDLHVATFVETIESLKGEPAGEVAARLGRTIAFEGIFILIAKDDHKIELLVSPPLENALSGRARAAIRSAFVPGFRQRDYDAGLKAAVSAIRDQLASAVREGHLKAGSGTSTPAAAMLAGPAAGRAASAGESVSLVTRNQVRLALAGARAIIVGAESKARAMNLNVNIAVVDDGGHLLAFERMDGARPASAYTALTKATTAATMRAPTGPTPAGTASPDALLNLSLQNAALASGGKITTLYGGVPVTVEGQVIGGVGVGGGTGEQDAQIARAGISAFLDELGGSRTPPTEAPASQKAAR
jgi:uncharacterized protein GlcG (DUF336 family)